MSNPKARILVIDDEKNIRKSVSFLLEDAGYEVGVAEDAIRAMERIREDSFDLILLDIKIGEISGLQLFEKIREEKINLPVVFMSGNASLSEAVKTIQLGGTDFLEKPFTPESLLIAVARALRMGEIENSLRSLKGAQEKGFQKKTEILGKSTVIRNLWKEIERVAPSKSKVLILGETGTGKELIARAIHEASSVSQGPFIKVNCAAIPESLVESEFFGHEKGSFTGAHQMKRGFFELAHKGTIFLDEIGEMSPSAQAKVLRVLQNEDFTRVGGSQNIKVDVRVISATHRDLAKEVKEGRFREDLFFRMSVVPIQSSPLRERKEDVLPLLQKFVEESCKENGFSIRTVTSEVIERLERYPWPGNVRELKNLAERLVVFSGEVIGLGDLPVEYSQAKEGQAVSNSSEKMFTLEAYKQKIEREYLVSVLQGCRGNVTQAAKVLDLDRTYLHRKIQDHGILKKEYF